MFGKRSQAKAEAKATAVSPEEPTAFTPGETEPGQTGFQPSEGTPDFVPEAANRSPDFAPAAVASAPVSDVPEIPGSLGSSSTPAASASSVIEEPADLPSLQAVEAARETDAISRPLPEPTSNFAESREISGPERGYSATPLSPASKRGLPSMAAPRTPIAPYKDPTRRIVDIPGSRRDTKPDDEGKKLIVGREIKLSGEISACDRLVVEGEVEANLTDAKAIEVAEQGLFKGTADIAEADISGRLEGTVTAREKLTVRAGGLIIGTVRYKTLVVEEGGLIKGTMECLDDEAPA
ncbi:MAG: bactofilin family protein [Rhodospirillaceae bacterium]